MPNDLILTDEQNLLLYILMLCYVCRYFVESFSDYFSLEKPCLTCSVPWHELEFVDQLDGWN